MLEILHNEDKTIKGVCEYYVVNSDGTMNDKGIYAWVCECEVNPQHRNNGCLKEFMRLALNRYPQLEFFYFKRLKYNSRLRLYKVKDCLN